MGRLCSATDIVSPHFGYATHISHQAEIKADASTHTLPACLRQYLTAAAHLAPIQLQAMQKPASARSQSYLKHLVEVQEGVHSSAGVAAAETAQLSRCCYHLQAWLKLELEQSGNRLEGH